MKRAIHPESVPGEPRAIRWVTETGLGAGRVLAAPGTVGPLLEYGVLTRILVEPQGVWTWLADGKTWTDHGPRIRDAVSAALTLDGWEISDGDADLLRLVAREVLDGELSAYIASHGGHIAVSEADVDTLTLDFTGACEDCPAAASTLHDRIETAVRARYPRLGGIRRTGAEPRHRGFLGIPFPRR